MNLNRNNIYFVLEQLFPFKAQYLMNIPGESGKTGQGHKELKPFLLAGYVTKVTDRPVLMF